MEPLLRLRVTRSLDFGCSKYVTGHRLSSLGRLTRLLVALYQGKYAEAVEHLRQGDPFDPYVKYQLAVATEGSGDAARQSSCSARWPITTSTP
jgi:hypothetical protein